jgi:SAM-dependent methyltransferase
VTKFYNRLVSKRTTQHWIQSLGPETMDAAEISGKRGTKWRFKSFDVFQYPEYDVCDKPFTDADGNVLQYDIFLADQVWEHLDRPYRATRNIYKMLRPGGYFWVCVPFYVRYHPAPHDNTRWTARGLKNLLIECGFQERNIHALQWGNRDCARREMGHRWAKVDPATDNLQNDPDFPVMSWALAKKPPGKLPELAPMTDQREA